MDELSGSAGDFREVLEQRVTAVLAKSRDPARDRESLAEEIGALRLVLARLLSEEEDSARLATAIPRVVDAVVRAVRLQRMLSGDSAESLTAALTEVLVELGIGGEG